MKSATTGAPFQAISADNNTLPKLPTDAEQDLRPNFHLAVFHRGERARLISISVKPFALPAIARESSARALVLTTSPLQARPNPRSDEITRLIPECYRTCFSICSPT
jgi:hypothetical protein